MMSKIQFAYLKMDMMLKQTKIKRCIIYLLMLTVMPAEADDGMLTGRVIGTVETVDYSTFNKSTTVNTREMAFDGNLNTYFASWERSYTWVGLDLGSPHIITKVGWSPRNDVHGEERVILGVFEGANREDFMDAIPLFIIKERGKIGEMSYSTVNCSPGFRYVRYIGPSDARCNIAEIEFYGYQGEGDNSHLYQLTNLPTVSIHTLDGVIPFDKTTNIEAQISIIAEGEESLLYESGSIRERGNYSRSFPKKPYRIKFDKKRQILDAPAKAKKWTLINNYGDKTLMRNLLAFELSRRMGMPYTPYGRAVDVLLNGEYKGCYQLCDQVEVRRNRVDITEMSPQDVSGSALTGGYFFEIDAYADQERKWFWSNQGNPVTIKSPDEDSIVNVQFNYIKNHFNKMENQWRNYLDLNTFLRHFLVGELSGNTDTYWSVFMYKQRDDDIVYTGPVWDFDLAFNNDNRTYPVNSKNDFIYRSGGSCTGNMRSFVDRIVINDSQAKTRLVELWDEARQNGLNQESLIACVDSLEEELQQSQELNFMRWPIMQDRVHQNPRIWGSYAEEVQNVRRFISERVEWMDKRLNYTFIPSSITDMDIDYDQPYLIYTISGRYCGKNFRGQPHGVYIVRQGNKAHKIIL